MNAPMRLFRHPNGYWYAELDRHRRRSLRTRDRAEAQKLFRRLKSEYLLNKIAFLEGRKPAPTLEDFAAEYLEWIYQALAVNTFSQARSGFKALLAHIPPATPINQIARHQIDFMQGEMTRSAKASTINTRFRNYHAAFNKAVQWGYLKKNPFARVKALQEQEALPRYLTREEIARLLEAKAHPRYLALWQMLLLTGCRRQEIVTLTWVDIDLPARRIAIRTTKNRRPKLVYISDDLLQILQQLNPGVGRLFPWSLSHVTRRFKRLCASVGIEARLHDLRHTYGSYMAMAGIDLLTIKTALGHRDLKSTQILRKSWRTLPGRRRSYTTSVAASWMRRPWRPRCAPGGRSVCPISWSLSKWPKWRSKMADIAHPDAMLVVPNGTHPLQESFITFLWDRELAAYLVRNPWVPKLEKRRSTALGVLVRQGNC